MFSLSGLVKSLGVVMSVFISISFILGFVQVNNTAIILTILYSLCYIFNGFLAPVWNRETPYFASFISSVTLTVLNLLFAVFVLDIMVFADPAVVNMGLVRNTAMSLLMTFLAVKIMAKKQRLQKFISLLYFQIPKN